MATRYAKAYIKKSSILQNAKFHRNQESVLRLDIKNFFPSITVNKCYFIFRELGYSKPISMLLAILCCLEDALPQGAPTSPALSNLIMRGIDARLGGYAIKNNLRYTRYADDMIFSGSIKPGSVISMATKILFEYNFHLNEKKTRLMQSHQRQKVTGLVVNKKLNISVEVKRKLIQEAYYINKFGLQSHIDKTETTLTNYIDRLIGMATFALSINKSDTNLATSLDIFKEAKAKA